MDTLADVIQLELVKKAKGFWVYASDGTKLGRCNMFFKRDQFGNREAIIDLDFYRLKPSELKAIIRLPLDTEGTFDATKMSFRLKDEITVETRVATWSSSTETYLKF